jgi:hypothetical protein
MLTSRNAISALLVVLLVVAAGCGAEPSSSPRATGDSNERRLSRADSLRLVAWARDFRSCMLGRGASLGPLRTRPTRISMELSASARADDVLDDTTLCGERQGGPPARASLQFRPGRIVLYLPERCLLDPKVTAS